MAKQALDAKRSDMFMIEPERLTLVYDKAHPLYDPRVENPPDESMIANIGVYGVQEPVLVRKNGDAIEVVAGRGRTKAALEANKRLKAEGKTPLLIPAIVKRGSDEDLFGILISENEIRREDSMIGKAKRPASYLIWATRYSR
jgi:ParB family chromosome partitioning protein